MPRASTQAVEPETPVDSEPQESDPTEETEEVEEKTTSGGQSMLAEPRTWTMIALTAVFVGLYVLALFGVIAKPADDTVLFRIEPILFAIIGYYFGREPSARTESRLSEEADGERDLRRRAEGQEKQQRVRAVRAQTRLESARAVLTTGAREVAVRKASPVLGAEDSQADDRATRHAAAAALRILE